MGYSIHWHRNGVDKSEVCEADSLDMCRDRARKLLDDNQAHKVEIYDQEGQMVAQFQNMIRNA